MLCKKSLRPRGIGIARVTVLLLVVVLDEPGRECEHRQQEDLRNAPLQLIERRSPCTGDPSSVLAELEQERFLVNNREVRMDIGPVGAVQD